MQSMSHGNNKKLAELSESALQPCRATPSCSYCRPPTGLTMQSQAVPVTLRHVTTQRAEAGVC